MLRIKKVEYVAEYKLKILFSNKKTKIVDFEQWVFEDNFYLKPLRDIQYFQKVRLDDTNYSICWPNGADFCPDVLFRVGQEIESKAKIKRSRPQKSRPQTKRKLSRRS